ncbi:MAG TPA: rod shape-determining protein MreD [Candidatus Rubrimentiphilum sp.]|nr:rod shape-determining protein MreD [Candidatus Rubrimentiphilum sp.]
MRLLDFPRWWQAAAALAIALLVQVEFMHYAMFRGAEPSLVLVTVVWYALRAGMRRAILFGLIAGAIEDFLGGALSGAPTGGAWTIATTFVALFISALSQRFFSDSVPVVAAVTILATLIRRLIFWSIMSLEGYPHGYATVHFHQALWEAVLNAALMVLLMFAARVMLRPRYQ